MMANNLSNRTTDLDSGISTRLCPAEAKWLFAEETTEPPLV